jgi:hypothetical protein
MAATCGVVLPNASAYVFPWLALHPALKPVDPKPLDPHEALLRALKALTEGHFDGREVQGAQANALESIAWSLAGLLADRVETAPVRPASVRPAPHSASNDNSLSHELLARGFVPLRN